MCVCDLSMWVRPALIDSRSYREREIFHTHQSHNSLMKGERERIEGRRESERERGEGERESMCAQKVCDIKWKN